MAKTESMQFYGDLNSSLLLFVESSLAAAVRIMESEISPISDKLVLVFCFFFNLVSHCYVVESRFCQQFYASLLRIENYRDFLLFMSVSNLIFPRGFTPSVHDVNRKVPLCT